MYIDELVTSGNIDDIKGYLGEFDFVEEIEVGDVLSVMDCEEGYRIIVWENRADESNAVIDFGDDYLWGEWDGARRLAGRSPDLRYTSVGREGRRCHGRDWGACP